MDGLLLQPAVQLYAVSACVLVVSLYGLGFWSPRTRAERKAVVNLKDMAVNSGAQVGAAEGVAGARGTTDGDTLRPRAIG